MAATKHRPSASVAAPPAASDLVVCQIGAREHYVIAATLHARGRLAALCTDLWVPPLGGARAVAALAGPMGRAAAERYDPALSGARVFSADFTTLGRRVADRLLPRSRWQGFMAMNRAFGRRMADRLEASRVLRPPQGPPPAVFAYSYAAREILEAAKRAGCLAILGQIDPGPGEHELVREIARRHGLEGERVDGPPSAYWDEWRAECQLADVVLANSAWSAKLLERAGVEARKIKVVPLAYRAADAPDVHTYPDRFTPNRPLRMLFLGQFGVRKGGVELLDAMTRLRHLPVELRVVGPAEPDIVERYRGLENVRWFGVATRSAVREHYAGSDLFVLPTHSDGFAITQLEAAAAGLPAIVSRNCGEVIEPGRTGYLLHAVDAGAIEMAVRACLEAPDRLQAMSHLAPSVLERFQPSNILAALDEILAAAR